MPDARDVILDLIDDAVSTDDPWVGRTYLREQARKDAHPGLDVDDSGSMDGFDRAYAALRQDVEIVCWHGLTTLADEELLQAAVVGAAEGSVTQKVLIGKLHKVKSGSWDPSVDVQEAA